MFSSGPNSARRNGRWLLIGCAVALVAVVVTVVVLATGDEEDSKWEACAYYSDHMQELAEATSDRGVHAERIDGWARDSDDAEFREAAAELVSLGEGEYDQDAWLNSIVDFGIACYGLPEGPETGS
ncbi:hypothetical protein [Streptomyces profundus]|uniref:hypothetical protein n=1 Tax=Streptomyces profundus TaxID=2867410 RepID=UPI001D168542|nr:hypothetical protein [Streptomyces sp. MA3_2.13]UED86216.1 hypothetical protein K4G22_20140 [Streptomyces sp. MA3_2.13]